MVLQIFLITDYKFSKRWALGVQHWVGLLPSVTRVMLFSLNWCVFSNDSHNGLIWWLIWRLLHTEQDIRTFPKHQVLEWFHLFVFVWFNFCWVYCTFFHLARSKFGPIVNYFNYSRSSPTVVCRIWHIVGNSLKGSTFEFFQWIPRRKLLSYMFMFFKVRSCLIFSFPQTFWQKLWKKIYLTQKWQ